MAKWIGYIGSRASYNKQRACTDEGSSKRQAYRAREKERQGTRWINQKISTIAQSSRQSHNRLKAVLPKQKLNSICITTANRLLSAFPLIIYLFMIFPSLFFLFFVDVWFASTILAIVELFAIDKKQIELISVVPNGNEDVKDLMEQHKHKHKQKRNTNKHQNNNKATKLLELQYSNKLQRARKKSIMYMY